MTVGAIITSMICSYDTDTLPKIILETMDTRDLSIPTHLKYRLTACNPPIFQWDINPKILGVLHHLYCSPLYVRVG